MKGKETEHSEKIAHPNEMLEIGLHELFAKYQQYYKGWLERNPGPYQVPDIDPKYWDLEKVEWGSDDNINLFEFGQAVERVKNDLQLNLKVPGRPYNGCESPESVADGLRFEELYQYRERKPAYERLREKIARMSPEELEAYQERLGELAAFYQGPGGP